ncbi:MAG: TIGR01906 family membrane protein [Clostridiales bacterium]|nr:TIGR01906 family membrane protein [Clostridiales bacterium]
MREENPPRRFTPLGVIAAILIAVLVISASVTAVLFDRGAYTRLQDRENLPQAVGMSREDVLENYNALIDYNSIFFTGPLEFPTLSMSEPGRVHFEEVKAIFTVFQIALIVSIALTAICCGALLNAIIKKRKGRPRSYSFLALGGALALAIPAAVVCVMGAVGWDRFFVMFHEFFFDNDYWVFDAMTDPVILILPDHFFLDSLVRIVAAIVISAAALIVGSVFLEKTNLRKNI